MNVCECVCVCVCRPGKNADPAILDRGKIMVLGVTGGKAKRGEEKKEKKGRKKIEKGRKKEKKGRRKEKKEKKSGKGGE